MYRKTLATRSGDGASKVRKFALAEQMAFLEDTIRHRRTRFNVKPVDEPSCSNASPLPVAEEEILSSQDLFDNEVSHLDMSCDEDHQNECTTSETPRGLKRKSENFKEEILKLMKKNSDLMAKEVYDDDMHFLMSFHNKLKNMDENLKAKVKLRIMHAVYDPVDD
ncbi:hypothetical protein X975_15446, partial [Stegodyphus mimosarum]